MPIVHVNPYDMLLRGDSLDLVASAMALDLSLQHHRIEVEPTSTSADTIPSRRQTTIPEAA